VTATCNQAVRQLSREVESSNTAAGEHDVKAVDDDDEDSEDQGT